MYVPSLELGLSHPLSRQRVFLPPPEPKGGGHTRVRVRGWGSPNSDDWRKSLALCLLCGVIECVSLINEREKLVRTDSRPQVQCREGGGEETFTISGRHVSLCDIK